MLTPDRVEPNVAPADDELVVVACKDEKGNTFNHYIRDAALKASLMEVDESAASERTLTRQKHSDEITELAARHGQETSEMNTRLNDTRTKAHAPVLERAAAEIAAAAEKAAEAAQRAAAASEAVVAE